MSRYRKIQVRTWSDEKFRSLSAIPPCGQGLWFFLLTGPFSSVIPGMFRAGKAAMAEELGWSQEAFQEAFQEVLNSGMAKADFEAKFVWLPNALLHNKPESPNVVKGWAAEFDLLPECGLKDEALISMKSYLYSQGEGYGKAFDEAFGKAYRKAMAKTMPNQEQEQEQEQEQKEKRSTGNSGESPGSPTASPKPEKAFDPELVEFVTSFQNSVREEQGAKAPQITRALIKKGCDAVDKLSRIDGHPPETVRDVLTWGQKDSFWSAQILSLAAVREKSRNGSTKFVNMMFQWEKSTGGAYSASPFEGGNVV